MPFCTRAFAELKLDGECTLNKVVFIFLQVAGKSKGQNERGIKTGVWKNHQQTLLYLT
jgi:hypothetical protein